MKIGSKTLRMVSHTCLMDDSLIIWVHSLYRWLKLNYNWSSYFFEKFALGPYHYIPEDTTDAVLFREMFSRNYWKLMNIVQAMFKEITVSFLVKGPYFWARIFIFTKQWHMMDKLLLSSMNELCPTVLAKCMSIQKADGIWKTKFSYSKVPKICIKIFGFICLTITILFHTVCVNKW
jgi:hypothetical protein